MDAGRPLRARCGCHGSLRWMRQALVVGMLLAMLLASSCVRMHGPETPGLSRASSGSVLRDGVRIPADALRADVAKVSLRLECVGVRTVQDLPEGWNLSASAISEDSLVTFTPATNAASREALGSARIHLRWRGLWSDCFGASAIAHARASDHVTRMCFELAFPSGDWSPVDCEHAEARWHANAPTPESAR